jgi:septal ring factor EnvC (AmiA/AmiB activator)
MPMRRARPSSLLALTVLAVAVAAHAARPLNEDASRRQMEQAERARVAELATQQEAAARAAAAAAESQRLQADRIAAAARLRHAETATAETAARLDQLAAQRRQAQASLDAHAETMQPLLPLIERLSLFPAETLLAVPAQPEETLRGVLVLRGLAKQLGQEAVALRQEQARLDTATQAMQAEAPKLEAAEAEQQAQSAVLDQQIATARAQQKQAEGNAGDAAQRAAGAASRADSLRAMLGELDAQRQADAARARDEAFRAERQKHSGEATAARQRQAALERPAGAGTIAAAAQPRGQMTAPVAGNIFRSWGDPTEGGPASGISYHAPPAARVVAPCGGRVVFAASFRSYGLLLIVDCGGGYHAVLAGFDRLDVKVGQQVAAGEPVGVMPAWEPGASGGRPALYVELRRDGQPVNPAPWLRSSG